MTVQCWPIYFRLNKLFLSHLLYGKCLKITFLFLQFWSQPSCEVDVLDLFYWWHCSYLLPDDIDADVSAEILNSGYASQSEDVGHTLFIRWWECKTSHLFVHLILEVIRADPVFPQLYNFQQHKAVSRYCHPQLQVGERSCSVNLTAKLCHFCLW